ncbi:hypothetical protein HDV06_000574 [Boothiomyces sp. JEL0866]|nr:hypothetical protein HDV06_000574 [Boothiomyces sp. JEL0866]
MQVYPLVICSTLLVTAMLQLVIPVYMTLTITDSKTDQKGCEKISERVYYLLLALSVLVLVCCYFWVSYIFTEDKSSIFGGHIVQNIWILVFPYCFERIKRLRIKKGNSMIFVQTVSSAGSSATRVKSPLPAAVKTKEVKSMSANSYPIEILAMSLDNTKFKNSSFENSKSSVNSNNSSQCSQQKKVPVKLDDLFVKDADFDKPKLPKPNIRKNQSFNYPPARVYQISDGAQRRSSLQDPTKTLSSSISGKTHSELGPKGLEKKESNSEVSKPVEHKFGRNRSVSDGPRLQINTNTMVLERKDSKNFQRMKSPLSSRIDADFLKTGNSKASLASGNSFSSVGSTRMKSNLSAEVSKESLKLEKSNESEKLEDSKNEQSWFSPDDNVIQMDAVEIHIDLFNSQDIADRKKK